MVSFICTSQDPLHIPVGSHVYHVVFRRLHGLPSVHIFYQYIRRTYLPSVGSASADVPVCLSCLRSAGVSAMSRSSRAPLAALPLPLPLPLLLVTVVVLSCLRTTLAGEYPTVTVRCPPPTAHRPPPTYTTRSCRHVLPSAAATLT